MSSAHVVCRNCPPDKRRPDQRRREGFLEGGEGPEESGAHEALRTGEVGPILEVVHAKKGWVEDLDA